MFLDTLHIIHYDGPPKPKQPSRRTPPFKTLLNEDRSRCNAERKSEGGSAPISDGVELNEFIYLGRYPYSWRDEFVFGIVLYGD